MLAIDLATGDIGDSVRLDGLITELFDVAAMPGVACPMTIGLDTPETRSTISFEPIA